MQATAVHVASSSRVLALSVAHQQQSSRDVTGGDGRGRTDQVGVVPSASCNSSRLRVRSDFFCHGLDKLSLSATTRSGVPGPSSVEGPLKITCKESRIGKRPITIPSEVQYTLGENSLVVKGPLGQLSRVYPSEVKLTEDNGNLLVSRAADTRRARQMHGLFRTLTDNMVIGVSTGFKKKLEMVGVGYRAALDGNVLQMSLGYSHPVRMEIPEGLIVKIEGNTNIFVSGYDKVLLGDFCATIRGKRPPEPYKGKGVKYSDEVIRRKEGKTGKKK